MKTTRCRLWVAWAFGLWLGAAGVASAATLDLDGPNCGGTVRPGETFTVRATVHGAYSAFAFRAYFNIDGVAKLEPIAESDYAIVQPGIENQNMLSAFLAIGDYGANGKAFVVGAIKVDDPFSAADGNLDLADVFLTVRPDATGFVTLTPLAEAGDSSMSSDINDLPVDAGTSCTVEIALDPLPPIADAGPDKTVGPGRSVTLDGSASRDRAGENNLQYAWEVVSGPGAFQDPDEPKPTLVAFEDAAPGYTILARLTVVDPDLGPPASDDVIILVQEQPKLPPEADAGANATVPAGGMHELDASGSRDTAGANNLTYLWELIAGPGSLAGDTNAVAAYSAPGAVSGDDVAVLLLTVTDPDIGQSDRDAIVLTVRSPESLQCADADGDDFFVEVAQHPGDTPGVACGPVDCNDNDRGIHPFQPEWSIWDHVDENCNGYEICGTLMGRDGSAAEAAAVYGALLLLPALLRRRFRPLGRRR